MNTGVITFVNAGHVPPKLLIHEQMKNCPTVYGLALQDKGEGQEDILDTTSEAKNISVDKMMEMLEQMKDQNVAIHFGNYSKFNADEDLQPFLFQQSDAAGNIQTILSCMIEGDFPQYARPDEGHTEEYNLYNDYIFPMLMEKFEASDGLDSFYAKLRTSTFGQSILNTMAHRGAVVLLPLTGQPINIFKNELGDVKDWGFTTNKFGWDKKEGTITQKATVVVNKAKSRLAAMTGGVVNPKDSTSTAALNTGLKFYKPPPKLQGNARNTWIRAMLDLSPQDPLPETSSHVNFGIWVPAEMIPFAERDITTREEAKGLLNEVKIFLTKSSVGPARVGTADKIGDAMAKVHQEPQLEQVQQPESRVSPSDFLPVLGADEKLGAVALVTGWAARDRSKMPSPLEIQRIESKWKPFSEDMGILHTDMHRWTIKDIKELCKKYPDAAALVIVEFRRKELELQQQIGLEEQIEKQPDKVQPQPETVTQPQAQPGKKMSRLERMTGKVA